MCPKWCAPDPYAVGAVLLLTLVKLAGERVDHSAMAGELARISPFTDTQLAALYRNHGSYVSRVDAIDAGNVAAGYILAADAELNQAAAARSDVGKK